MLSPQKKISCKKNCFQKIQRDLGQRGEAIEQGAVRKASRRLNAYDACSIISARTEQLFALLQTLEMYARRALTLSLRCRLLRLHNLRVIL